jgi:hypothetical protein
MPTTNKTSTEADALTTTHHLVTAESRGRPLCGEASPDAAIGSFVEHLDENQEFVREVFGKGGKPATACQQCLALYPSLATLSRDERAVRRLTPFNVRVNVSFAPDSKLLGYRVKASGIAEIGEKRVVVCVFPHMAFTTARTLTGLSFDMTVDANTIIPLINKANKE